VPATVLKKQYLLKVETMNNGKKLIWAVLCGLPADSQYVKDALGSVDTARELLEASAIGKEELLAAEGTETALISQPQVWDKFPVIAQMLRAQGQEFTTADLTTKRGAGETPIRYAERHGKLDKLFSADVWQGRLAEMDRLFYTVSKTERDKMNYVEIRRSVAAATGDLTADDRLRSYGLEPMSVRTGLYQGNVAELKDKLAANGDRIRKEYLFILDSAGDNMFEYAATFDNMDSWLPELEAHGERLTKEDCTATMIDKRSILDFAAKHNKLDKLFRARVWKGHGAEMMELFNTLPETERAKVNINAVLSDLKEAEYGARVSTASLADLTKVFNEHERGGAAFFPVHALGFEKVWKDMDNVRAALAARGENLTLDHLRQPAGMSGESVMMFAARNRHFAQVMAIASDARQRVTLDELTAAGPLGKSILDVMVEKGDVAQLFVPEQWVGRGRELVELWNKVPVTARKDIDFETIAGRVNVMTLRERVAGVPRPSL
jgi:hypothetical protein